MPLPQNKVKKLKINSTKNANTLAFASRIGYYDIVLNAFTTEPPPPYPLPSDVQPFWIFGDGNYSLEHDPVHIYGQSGAFAVYLKSNGTYKPSRPTSIAISTSDINLGTIPTPSPSLQNREIELKSSWEPIAGENIYYIITVENKQSECSDGLTGVITFEYPENQLIIENVPDPVYYMGFLHEPNFSRDGLATYSFSGLRTGEQRHLFIEAKAMDSLSLDTEITCKAALKNIETIDKEVIRGCSPKGEESSITGSVKDRPRDPNNKVVSESTIHEGQGPFRLYYTINFQNIKGGDAAYIRIEDKIDDTLLDVSSFHVEGTSHNYENPVFINNTVIINFPNINLISMESVYKNVFNGRLGKEKLKEGIHLTTGFITYSILTKDNYKVEDIISNQALITFRNSSADQVFDSVWTNIVETLVIPTKCKQENSYCLPNLFCIILIITSILVLSLAVLILAIVLLQQL